MDAKSFSRRGFLRGAAVTIGAAAGARLAPGAHSLLDEALAAPAAEKPAVLVVYTLGGYNSIFGSAQPLQGSFGVTATNFTALGNGVTVDNTFNTFDAFSKAHMSVIGVRHGISAHDTARLNTLSNGQKNYVLQLADAMGGTAPIKCAFIGNNYSNNIVGLPTAPINGVSLQAITDMKPAIDALGGGGPDPRAPDRSITAGALVDVQTMSQQELTASPGALATVTNGYAAAVDTLKQPAQAFSFADLQTAYGLAANKTAVANNDFKAKMAAAELMILAGANVVWTVEANPGWDTHGDTTGTKVRNQMTSYLLPPLTTFSKRMLQAAGRNVVVVIMGEFARSLPGSNHQPNLSATVIGKYVKQGTTGMVDAKVGLPANTPSSPGLWAYVAAVAKAPANPFGANPHPLVL